MYRDGDFSEYQNDVSSVAVVASFELQRCNIATQLNINEVEVLPVGSVPMGKNEFRPYFSSVNPYFSPVGTRGKYCKLLLYKDKTILKIAELNPAKAIYLKERSIKNKRLAFGASDYKKAFKKLQQMGFGELVTVRRGCSFHKINPSDLDQVRSLFFDFLFFNSIS